METTAILGLAVAIIGVVAGIYYKFFRNKPQKGKNGDFVMGDKVGGDKITGDGTVKIDTGGEVGGHVAGRDQTIIQANKVTVVQEQPKAAVEKKPKPEVKPAVEKKPKPEVKYALEISTGRLPHTEGAELFGRDGELARLDAAWEDPGTHVISLAAFGGVGKTALVKHWLAGMAAEDYRGAERVFDWSFYSQGTSNQQATAEIFIAEALKWFGDPDPAEGSPFDKGRRLADLARRRRMLLVLDGLEPLQHPPGKGLTEGALKDPGLKMLLEGLAASNPGLCVVTSRERVQDIAHFAKTTAPVVELENLSEEAGAQVLGNLGVEGPEEELRAASREFGGHGLALNLLGTFLSTVRDGDVRRRGEVHILDEDEEKGGHARRVMRSYEGHLSEVDLALLRIAGLFGRPAGGELVEVLKGAAIAGLTEPLAGLAGKDWKRALKHLREARLLAGEDPADKAALDAHPLVREYFGDKLRDETPEAWRAGHDCLYEHLAKTADELPEIAEAMAPLFAAVAHGCAAGRHQEAMDEVCWRRIKRGDEFFSTKKLGLFGSELAALSGFFAEPWTRPVDALAEDDKGFVLNAVGFHLRALGRLAEAAQSQRAGLDMEIAQEDWENAAQDAGNLSELHLARGAVAEAVEAARQSVDLADSSGDTFMRMYVRTTLADALHQAGEAREAVALFRKAEAMQKERYRECPFLYSVQGFRYCDLLLGRGEHKEVRQRAGKTIEVAHQHLGHLDIALDSLTLGRAALAGAAARGPDGLEEAERRLDEAVEGLRRAGERDELPRGLLARAELWRCVGDGGKARRDLDEALTIATRGGMRLFEADAHLEYTRLHLAEGGIAAARECFAKAKAIVADTGYRRRAKEVAELEKRLG
ncbi:MAG: NACHT domain-containing protein [Rhodospirillales bacterium]|nr:NACHT domain-containing protein [Rhodospirillales bacterium]